MGHILHFMTVMIQGKLLIKKKYIISIKRKEDVKWHKKLFLVAVGI